MNTQRILPFCLVLALIILQQACKVPILDPPCPILTRLVIPANGAHGDEMVTIIGRDFKAGAPHLYQIKIGDSVVPAKSMEVLSDTSLRFMVPAGIGSGNLSVGLANGNTCSGSIYFNYRIKISDLNNFTQAVFLKPQGIAINDSGYLFVADKNHHKIVRVSPAGVAADYAGRGLNSVPAVDNQPYDQATFYEPDDASVASNGDVFVADAVNNGIRRINSARYVSTAAGKTGFPGGDVNLTPSTSLFNYPTGITVDKNNNIYVAEPTKNRIRYIDFGASKVSTTTIVGNVSTTLSNPYKLFYSEKRNPQFPLFIADLGNKRILEINNAGAINPTSFSAVNSLGALIPYDLELDDAGNIIVLDKSKKLFVIYKDNTIEQLNVNFTAQTTVITGIAVDTKRKKIYISDENQNRILVASYY